MLSPEVWDFKPPQHCFSTEKQRIERNDAPPLVSTHYFNHSVSVVLPDTASIPDGLRNNVSEDTDYYRVNRLNVSDLLDKEFVEAFVKRGELSVLAIGNAIDLENSIAVVPSGSLIISLSSKDFQKLGLEGKPSFFDHKVHTRYVDLALYSVGEFVATFGRSMIQPVCMISKTNAEQGHLKLQSTLHLIKHLLSTSVPRHLYDKMSVAILNAVVDLIKETRGTYNDYALTSAFLTEITVVLHLTEVGIGANLTAIEFAAWPKIMRHILYNKLHEMVGLHTLDLGSGSAGWRTSDIEKIIINGVTAMPNLVSFTLCFDCTDNIVLALSQNCRKLQKLDVTASRSVTDRSVLPLLTCRHLREAKLFRTSITVAGYADLFGQHTNIEDIGRCDEFGYVLEHIHQNRQHLDSSFNITAFESRNFSLEQMNLLVDMCPYITSLCLLRDDRILDLTILATLSYLRELKLLSCNYYTHGINTLLEINGPTIISLHLEHVDEIDLNALINISQFCPDMKNLVFYNCEFLERGPIYPRKLPVPPFKYLERIKCVTECANTHLEFLLSHCTNIKFIQLGSSTGIGDETMKRILAKNPMRKLEELKILYSHDLSMGTVQLLMQNCGNLHRLAELESWQGITPDQLASFRDQLKKSNTNLDTSPSLSFA